VLGIKEGADQQVTPYRLKGTTIGRRQEPIRKIVCYKKYRAKKELFKG
jgi:hypothetical protein